MTRVRDQRKRNDRAAVYWARWHPDPARRALYAEQAAALAAARRGAGRPR